MKRLFGFVLICGSAALVPAGLRLSGTVVGAQAQPPAFAATLYPVFEAADCRSCHTDDGVASGTRLHFPPAGASREDVEAFGVSLAPLVNRADPSRSLLLNKPTNRVRHTGGERIAPGSAGAEALEAWVRHLAAVPDAEVAAARARLALVKPAAAHGPVLRRLTHSQYNNTVRDLLGDYSRPADRFPPEAFVNGFRNQISTQGIPPVLEEAYSAAAERMATNAFRAGDVNDLIPCTPASAGDAACRDAFVRAFGQKAFRRPLTGIEVRRYAALFDDQAARAGRFLDGARVVVEAMLQSPKFLFHLTAGEDASLRDYAIASRLAYLLWDTMPDQPLLDRARNGELRTAAGLERVARAMLQDARARQATDEFFSQWLRFDRTLTAAKDEGRFPSFTPELAAMMVQETNRLLSHLVWNDGNFMEAFTADYSFLNAELARLYGVPAPAREFERAVLPADAKRAGILGQAAFLTATAGPEETSPTARGLFVREHLLCQIVPSPPPGVNTNLPEPSADAVRAKRERMLEHAQNTACAGCHRLMDPIGFGLENYDAIGTWRDQEEILLEAAGEGVRRKTVEVAITPAGEIAGIPASTFGDARQLGRVLAASPVCQDCVVKQMFRYAFGRPETPADRPAVTSAADAFRASGFKFREILLALVRSPQFLEGL